MWAADSDTSALQPDAAHVWLLELDALSAWLPQARALLSDDERARMDRYRVEAPRTSGTLTRAALRLILGRWLGVSPQTLVFGAGEHGKPFLPAHPHLQFNVSHSHHRALIALDGRGLELGVDVEWHRPRIDHLAIARHVFSLAERDALSAAPAADRPAMFFAIWSRKEAVIKATGDGLHRPLDAFDVSTSPLQEDAPALLATRDDPADAARWNLLDLPVPPCADGPYAASLLVRAPAPEVRLWRFGA